MFICVFPANGLSLFMFMRMAPCAPRAPALITTRPEHIRRTRRRGRYHNRYDNTHLWHISLRTNIWVFRDVVFQDVGFQTNKLKPLTQISFRWEVPTPSVLRVNQLLCSNPTSSNTTSLNSRNIIHGAQIDSNHEPFACRCGSWRGSLGLALQGSYLQGVRSAETQATPQEIRPKGC